MVSRYPPEYDEPERTTTGRIESGGTSVKVYQVDPEKPLGNLAGVPVYTEIDCPKCSRIVYWIETKMNFKCFGCDLPPAECPCKPPRKLAKSTMTEKVLRG